jgi:hypothetical protein
MLIRDIERFLRQSGLPPTTFGRLAASDPRLVFDLRKGREPRKGLRLKVEHFMNTFGASRHAV